MTYGRALFEVAEEAGQAEELLEEAEQVMAIFREDPQFYEFFSTPVISMAEKKAVMERVFAGKISPALLNLMFVLIDKRRGNHFERIIKQYRRCLDENRGFAPGVIYSVVPLEPEQLARFEEETGKLLGKRVKLSNQLHPELIGGVQIFIEGKVIDASVRKRLTDMKESLN
ncbi:MAG: ATP synthase F1 subunit delta [Bacillota bacterium]|nr:ATP synthase F1 subunit delta [Bacillota bacterium]